MSELLQWTAFGVTLLCVVVVVIWASSRKDYDNGRRLPPSPGPGWPLVGHLPLLARTSLPQCRYFIELSKMLGPIFSLRLGSLPIVVVSSAELAREVLLTHDKILASRPENLQLTKTLLYGPGNEIVFAKYGDSWQKLRKTLTQQLLTVNKLAETRHVREEEVRSLVHRIAACPPGAAVDIRREAYITVAGIISRLVNSKKIGERDGDGNDFLQIILGIDDLSKHSLGDLFPLLRWTDNFVCKPQMRALHKRLDGTWEGMLEERRQLMRSSDYQKRHDLVEFLLYEASQGTLSGNEIKGILTDAYIAGISTSVAAIEWAFAELIANKDCMNILQNEIHSVVGRGNEVLDSDILRLQYLQWTIKEVLRLHPIVPLLIPHLSMDDCEIGNCFIPKGTQVLVNVFAIGRDSSFWDNPECFNPSRFKDVKVDVKGFNYELLPFGSGRRICPGMPLGISLTHLIVGNLIAKFEWTCQSLDMIEHTNSIAHKKHNPMLAIPKTHLPI